MTVSLKPLILLTFSAVLFLSTQLKAEETYLLDKIIVDVIQNSPQFNIIDKESESERFLNETELSVLDLNGYVEANYTDQESPETSPFSTREANFLDYGLEFSKLWLSGFTTSLSYKVLDRENIFYNGATNSFIAPTLDFSIETNLFQDLFGNRYGHMFSSVQEENKTLMFQNQIDKKAFLKTLIKDFIDVYISREEFRIQKSLCESVNSHFKILAQKRAKKIISKRDYLLGEKELKSCEISISQYKSNLLELESAYRAQYYSPIDGYIEKLNALFLNIENQVSHYKKEPSDIEQSDEIVVLDRKQKALEFKQRELEAQNQIPLSLGVSVGSTGLDNTLTPANQDVSNLEFPYAKVSMRIDLPIVNRKVKNETVANSYALEAIKKKKELTQSMIQSDYKTVSLNIARDLDTQIKFSEKVKLSQRILKEAQKDFKNGKIDYFELVEYQKSMLESQKELSQFRRETVDKIIQFLDYSRYFHKFIAGI